MAGGLFHLKAIRAAALTALLAASFVAAPAWAANADDPFEGLNRAVFAFNDGADALVVRPVASVYKELTPQPARTGVNNFFRNLFDVNATLNAMLQGRFRYAVDSASRVVVNSTLGFFGLFDVASDMGIPQYQTDFGHTLAIWGAPRGPYLMLPLLGPRTVRSTVATGVDGWASPMGQAFADEAEWTLRTLDIIDQRARLLGTEQLISGDRYLFIRDVYLQQRAVLVNDGVAPDEFSEFDAEWEEDGL